MRCQSEDWLYWRLWGHWKPSGQAILQIMTWTLCMLRVVCKKWKQPVAFYLIRGSTKRETLVIFLMPATMQDWYLLPPCWIWLSTISWLCNSWLFLKRHFLSGITINILQQTFQPPLWMSGHVSTLPRISIDVPICILIHDTMCLSSMDGSTGCCVSTN